MKKNYIAVLAIIFMVLFVLPVMTWTAYNFIFSDKKLVKIPLLDNVFIVRDLKDDGEVLFNEYLLYMKEKGYQYLPDERMGGIIWFEKDGREYDFLYPKFKNLSSNN
jgi:hypothetical protein